MESWYTLTGAIDANLVGQTINQLQNLLFGSGRTGKTDTDIETFMKEVKVISADQAKNYGIVTRITDKLPRSPLGAQTPVSQGQTATPPIPSTAVTSSP